MFPHSEKHEFFATFRLLLLQGRLDPEAGCLWTRVRFIANLLGLRLGIATVGEGRGCRGGEARGVMRRMRGGYLSSNLKID